MSIDKLIVNLVFETPRLRLKPIRTSDRNMLHGIFIDPFVRKYLCDDRIWSLEQVEEMLVENQRLFEEQKLGLWLIETKRDREIIGFTGLWYFFDEEQPQLVYALLPNATQQGYATEAAQQMIDYSFNELGYTYLLASTDRPNLKSQQVAQRLGMRNVEERMINENPTVFFKLEK
jgi:ribosomal-protein-alanine N-acetyltransferase